MSQGGAAALLAGLAGPLREWLGEVNATAVASGVIGRGHLGGAGMGDGPGISELSTERLAQGRPGRPEEQQRVAELERLVGRLTLELEVAKKASSILQSHLDGKERWR